MQAPAMPLRVGFKRAEVDCGARQTNQGQHLGPNPDDAQ